MWTGLANPTPDSRRPRLLVLELWGLGDLALALPFLRAAAEFADVTLLAKPHAAPLLRRFAPTVELIALDAPWTAFRGKYRLHRWPWPALAAVVRELRARGFDLAASARPDPRDHLLMRLGGARERYGFARAGSGLLLSRSMAVPHQPHRADHWRTLAGALGWEVPSAVPPPRSARHIVMHTGAAQAVREWPRERFEAIAGRLREADWRVTLLDNSQRDLDALLETLATADRFIGNDSGPGHLAALLGVPTFTIFGPQLPECFSPQHPLAAWIEGAPCPYKPCHDYCRFAQPNCLHAHSVENVWTALQPFLRTKS
jgi:ADP-heptose:LPS heptosyltransferase